MQWGDKNITMKIDLEEWFDYVILMRGKEYFLDDRLIDLKKTGLRYNAKEKRKAITDAIFIEYLYNRAYALLYILKIRQ